MPKPRKTRRSPEERKAERAALLDRLGDKVATLASSAEWIAWLRFTAAFRRYSLNNQLLIAIQYPGAQRVAGFRRWQTLGRPVRKGEKAIKILGYSTKKITETDPEIGEEREARRVPRFPVLSVFDVSQTDGDPLPTDPYALPTGDGPAGALTAVQDWLRSQGWTLHSTSKLQLGGAEGITDHHRHTITTATGLASAARLAVLLHEAAHALLHADDTTYQQHRGICETEAESTAYVLTALLGMPTDASSIPYITGWSRAHPDLIRKAASNVLHAVNTIAAGIGLDQDEQDAADVA